MELGRAGAAESGWGVDNFCFVRRASAGCLCGLFSWGLSSLYVRQCVSICAGAEAIWTYATDTGTEVSHC